MQQYDYILEKIMDAEWTEEPFRHVYIEDFLSDEHFEMLTSWHKINLPAYEKSSHMLYDMKILGYEPVPFPGCTTDVNEYLRWYDGQRVGITPSHAHGLIEGFGLAMRLMKYDRPECLELIDFLNSKYFLDTLQLRLGVPGEVSVETAIQKYVSGYEISPHPDIRKKCATYMININPGNGMENLDIHTHFMKFKPQKKWIYNHWKTENVERCWVPWDWCDTVYIQNKNNSISMFAPGHDTLHAVKLDYNHLTGQRTQIYGNLWYTKRKHYDPNTWRHLI